MPAYGAFASRVNRVQLVQWVTLFFASNLVLFLLALGAGLACRHPYFLWLGIFNVMVIAQFWAFANDLYTQEQGRRHLPADRRRQQPRRVAGIGASGLSRREHRPEAAARRRGGHPGDLRVLLRGWSTDMRPRAASRRRPRPATTSRWAREGGFAMIFEDRYLLLIAALTVLLNVVNTSGEYLFGRYVVEQANTATRQRAGSGRGARSGSSATIYSRFFSTVNLAGFLLQMFVVSRVFKFLGVGRALFIHPIVALTGYLLMLRAPSMRADGVPEGRRQRHRLLAGQHDQAGAVAADQP